MRSFEMHGRRTAKIAMTGLGMLLAAAAVAQFVGPVVPIVGKRTAGFFDATYAKEQGVQHLGVDISAKENVDVRSPVDGTVVLNNTWAPDVMQAYLVIKGPDGEHVLGHISSTLAQGKKVTRNQVVGKVRPWPGNSHVHWGINKNGVAQAMTGKWGWGRAPLSAKVKDATDKGWVNF
jgi:murein DD-endopeptidase MepM/ murein hydrolase activator NlpD